MGGTTASPAEYVGTAWSHPITDSDRARFWAKVDARETDGCWVWTASRESEGYGHFFFHGRLVPAHRLAFVLCGGTIPEGMELDHLCHDPAECNAGRSCLHRRCVNPAHLAVVTPSENTRRSNASSIKMRCPRGHPYDGDNLYVYPDGRRGCRICGRAAVRRWRQRQAEQ